MSMASPSECRIDADCTHRSTDSGRMPSARNVSTLAGQVPPRRWGVLPPQGRAIRSSESSITGLPPASATVPGRRLPGGPPIEADRL